MGFLVGSAVLVVIGVALLALAPAKLQLQLGILVEIVVFRHADVVSSKGANRLLRLPERDHQEMCGIASHAAQRASALVTGGRAVVGYGDGSHQVQVPGALERRIRARFGWP
jgi:hypothetical protein